MKLGLLAIFRNEAHILDEFIKHYQQQGVDHFYLINNASTDDYKQILNKYSKNITLLQESYVGPTQVLELGGRQLEAYNEALTKVTTEWLFICDLDEFAYGRRGLTLKQFLIQYGDTFEQVLVPLKTFNSNGHIAQPSSVIQGFTQRRRGEHYTLNKAIVKVEAIEKIRINYCTLKWGRTVDAALQKSSDKFVTKTHKIEHSEDLRFRDISGGLLQQSWLVGNHYTVQSYDWFFGTKATRGTATWHGGPKIEAQEWFQQVWDKLHSREFVEDRELLELSKL